MIALLALTLAPATPPPPVAVESDPIVVVGKRLRRAGGAINHNPLTGKTTCKVANYADFLETYFTDGPNTDASDQ